MLQAGEPRHCNPAETTAGIPVEVSVAPVIPFVMEPDLERVLEAAREAGAVYVHYTVLAIAQGSAGCRRVSRIGPSA